MKYILILFLFVSCNVIEVVTGVKAKVDPALSNDRGKDSSLTEQIEMYFNFNGPQGSNKNSLFGGYVLDDSTAGGISIVTAPFGSAVDCTSASIESGQNLLSTSSFSLGLNENYNISFFVKQSTFEIATIGTIIGFSNGYIDLGPVSNGDGIHDLRFSQDMSTMTNVVIESVANLQNNNWVHISVNVYDYNQVDVYSDGNYIFADSLSGSAQGPSNNTFSICSRIDGGSVFQGQIAALGIWRRTLSQDEIRELYEKGID